MYKLTIPKEQMRSMFLNRQLCGGPSIAQQAREAIAEYLEKRSLELGTDVKDAAEAIERHEREKSQSNS